MHEDEVSEHGAYFGDESLSGVATESETKKNTAADFNLKTESAVSQRSFVELQTQVLRQQYVLNGFKFQMIFVCKNYSRQGCMYGQKNGYGEQLF